MNKKGKRIFIFLGVITTFIALCMWYFSIPQIIDTASQIKKLQSEFHKETGQNLIIKNFSFKLTPDFSIHAKAQEIEIINPKTKEQTLDLVDIDTKIAIFPLIFKKISVRNLNVENVTLQAKRYKNGEFSIEKIRLKNIPFEFSLKSAKAKISRYEIILDDQFSNNFFKLQGFDLNVDKLSDEKNIKFKSRGKLFINKDKCDYDLDLNFKTPIKKYLAEDDFKLQGYINNLPLKPFEKYISIYSKNNINKAKGIVSIAFDSQNGRKNKLTLRATLKDIEIQKDEVDSKIIFPSTSVITLNSSYDAKTFNIEDAAFISKTINVKLKGKIEDYSGNSEKINLNLKTDNSQIRSLVQLLPDSIKTSQDSIRKIKKYNLNGIACSDIKIIGKLKKPELYGKINFKDLYVIKPLENSPKAHGFAIFQKDQLNLNIRAFTSKNQYIDIIGQGELYGKQYGKYIIKSSDNVDLKKAHSVLLPVRDVIGFNLGPLPIMRLSGGGSINITTKGTLKDATCDGVFNLNNSTASISGLETFLTNAYGQLVFIGKKMHFKDTKAKLNDSDVYLEGYGDDKGFVDLKVKILNLDLPYFLQIVAKSPSLYEIKNETQAIEKAQGRADLVIFLKGRVKTFSDLNIQKLLNPSGTLTLKGASINIKTLDVPITNLFGNVDFGKNYSLNTKGKLLNSEFQLEGNLNKNVGSFNIKSKRFKLQDGIELSKPKNLPSFVKNIKLDFGLNLDYKGDIYDINPKKAEIKGFLVPLNSSSELPYLKFKSGIIRINNDAAKIENLNFEYLNSSAKLNAYIKNIYDKNPIINGGLDFFGFELNNIKKLKHFIKDPQISSLLNTTDNYKGNLSGNLDIKDNNFKGNVNFNNISLTHSPSSALIILKGGKALFDNNKISLKSLNMTYDDIPVYLNANVQNYTSKPKIESTFSVRLSEGQIDKYLNAKMTYPLKTKGEIAINGSLKGGVDNYDINSSLKLNEGTDIAYMGANIGDSQTPREIKIDANVQKNKINLKNFQYIKYETSQNSKLYPVPMISARGRIFANNKKYNISDFKIETENPTTARFFNVLFKKSILKQGLFTCDLNLSGNLSSPSILGNFSLESGDIPLFDVTIKDIDLKFEPQKIYTKISGLYSDSDFHITGEVQNKTTLPVRIHNISAVSNKILIDNILNNFNEISRKQNTLGRTQSAAGETISLNPKDIIIEKGTFKATNVKLKNIDAKNLTTNFKQGNDSIFRLNNMVFDFANGKMNGSASYNFSNTALNLDLEVRDVDANKITHSLLGVDNQIFGILNGNLSLFGSHLDEEAGLKTLNARGNFAIHDGRMPKLGSLEYLLRAGNLVKSGVFGLSLNNIIEILIPYKTGEFSSIKGVLSVKNGQIDNLEVYSTGKDLSLYIFGTYDLIQSEADLKVLGRLSRKVANILGPLGNASINTLLDLATGKKLDEAAKTTILKDINKIPGIEISNNDYRIFAVKIKGDLNLEGYVKEFKWVE